MPCFKLTWTGLVLKTNKDTAHSRKAKLTSCKSTSDLTNNYLINPEKHI